jgi:hypothetical protein
MHLQEDEQVIDVRWVHAAHPARLADVPGPDLCWQQDTTQHSPRALYKMPRASDGSKPSPGQCSQEKMWQYLDELLYKPQKQVRLGFAWSQAMQQTR